MTSLDVLPSRRTLLRGVGALGAAGATGASVTALAPAASADDAGMSGMSGLRTGPSIAGGSAPTGPSVAGRSRRSRPLKAADRHLVKRFSYGLTPKLARKVRKQGGARQWFERQLAPGSIADGSADELESWWPSTHRSAADIWNRQIQEIEGGWQVVEDYQRLLLIRRIRSNRQVLELMTEFWGNHFNVTANGDGTSTYRCAYDRALRGVALGSFRTILHTAITHPAMSIYLDNATSTKNAPNENLGREMLELHTVGRGNYSEDDVKAAARVLTGYAVDLWRTWNATYDPAKHWTGPVRVMDFSHANGAADGRPVVAALLDHLARSPLTARRLAHKLAVKFVSDEPSEELVEHLAGVYLDNDTEIKPVLRALVRHKEFAESAGQKVRDPGEDVVATYRALQVRLARPPAGESSHAADGILWQSRSIGSAPFSWPRPDGQPVDNQTWASPARMLSSMELHWTMAGRWWPTEGITYRGPAGWMPKKKMRMKALVDHLSVQLLGEHASGALLQACYQATGFGAGEMIQAGHPLLKWHFHRVLGTILDSPTHMTR